MKVICISGKGREGKDTSANILKELLEDRGDTVLVAHYADLLKYICKTYFDWDGKKDARGRSLLQHVGTDVIRELDDNYWVKFIGDILTFFPDAWDYVIIADCRFPNEIDYLETLGLDVIHLRVVRDGFVSPLTEEQQKHPSETALDDTEPDFYIHNSGTLEDLKNTIAGLLEEIDGYHQITFDEFLESVDKMHRFLDNKFNVAKKHRVNAIKRVKAKASEVLSLWW